MKFSDVHWDKNLNFKYRLMGSELVETERGKDLGVIMDNSMTVSTKSAAVAKKVNSIFGKGFSLVTMADRPR